jgi:hypothetical protein
MSNFLIQQRNADGVCRNNVFAAISKPLTAFGSCSRQVEQANRDGIENADRPLDG